MTAISQPAGLSVRSRRIPVGGKGAVAIVALLAVWETFPRLDLVDRVFLPPLSEVLTAWWALAQSGDLATHLGASLLRPSRRCSSR